jgi:transposase
MLTIGNNARLFLFKEPMDMRKSFEGLSSAISQAFPDKLMTGAYFLFLNRRKDHLKILYWDQDGFAIWYKRLEKGTFAQKAISDSLTRKEFFMLLEGITPKRIQPRYTYI